MRDKLIVQTHRLTLRPFLWSDLDDVFDLHSDPEVMRFITNGAPDAMDCVVADLRSWVNRGGDVDGFGRGLGFLAAVDTQSAEFVGWFHLRPGDGCSTDELELGFRLLHSAWGRGFATEGSSALVDRAFTALTAVRILGRSMLVHHASRRVMEKAGLRLARTFPTECANWNERQLP